MTDGLGLEGAYSETLSRIKGQGEEEARLGMATLMWISHSEQPLKADELCHALGVEIGSLDLEGDNVPSIGTLLGSCQGLATVDKEASTIRLIHFTLQEYLRAHPQLFNKAHSTMAETCLSYLNSHQVRALSTSPSRDLRGTPFLEYSSLYWGVHAKRDLSDRARLLALKLFDDYSNHISPKILLDAQKPPHYLDFYNPSGFSDLHCASFFGIVEIVAGFVEMEYCDINQTDFIDCTPLMWAARNGHDGVVKILLGRGDINPDKPDIEDQTPLLYAAMNGHEGVVKILLGRYEVNPDKPAKYGQTPLLYAAMNGHEEVVKILLGRHEVNPDKPDKRGRTPLRCAAESGHEEVVKTLLGRDDVNPDRPDKYSKTPLWWAAKNGHEGVVKTLLGRDDVNPDKPDLWSQTPLSCAASNGREGVVKILLGRDDVYPDNPDTFGQTSLLGAAKNGHEGVVKMLLDRDDVDPDKLDQYGLTPLSYATYHSYTTVIALLQPPKSATPSTE